VVKLLLRAGQSKAMRLLTYEGVEHELSERNWRQLLRRFDAERASLNAFGYNFIPVKAICVGRDYKCIRCPLRDPHKKINSCTYLFSKIIGEELLQRVHVHDSGILWEPRFDAEARLALQKVKDYLRQAKIVNKRRVKS
jgi:hypothetical protein